MVPETRGIGEIGEANPPQTQSAGEVVRELWTTWNSETSHELRRLCVANLAFFATIAGANMTVLPLVLTCVEIKILRRVRANHRVVLHAIDATPARWRGDAGSSPLDRASTAASSPRIDLVKNYRCTRYTG